MSRRGKERRLGNLEIVTKKFRKELSREKPDKKKLVNIFNELYDLATKDPLTGVLNRRSFDEALGKEVSKAIRYKRNLCIVMIDIDRFKSINDKYGHQIGDLVLKYLGNIVRDNIRDYDLFCRYGGEEFAILFPGLNANLTSSIAERIRMGLEKTTISVGNYIFNVTASFGIEGCKDDIEDKDKIL